MLRTLRITNFRGLREFAMSGLGRVNLLVGTNNSGKTSVLEAIHLLSSPGSLITLTKAQSRRGELVTGSRVREVDVAHLVHGHQLVERGGFSFEGESDGGRRSMTALFSARETAVAGTDEDEDEDDQDEIAGVAESGPPLWLQLTWSHEQSPRELQLAISRRGGLRERTFTAGRSGQNSPSPSIIRFITTSGLTPANITAMFDRVVLTPDEARVLKALHTIEPSIERIASVGAEQRFSTRDIRGGLVVMVAGQRIPIGSMGDGIWRLLGIALALVRARGGVLLVDEIDTGLHYSVLVNM